MRNFNRGSYKDSGFSSRNDRRNDREPRYRQNDHYKRPADKGFNRSFPERHGNPRRDFDNDRIQERRDVGGRGSFSDRGGMSRSFADRNFRNTKPERSFRNPSPVHRSRDRDGDSRLNRSNDIRTRPRPASPIRGRNDFPSTSIRPRPTRGGIQSRRGTGQRIIRRNDLRSSLISKRSAPSIRSKEYIKKIKQARMKLGDTLGNDNGDEEDPTISPKESRKEHEDNEDDTDFLDVANDVNFEDEDDAIAKRSSKAKSEEKLKPDDEKEVVVDKELSDKLNASGTSKSDERSHRARSEKSLSIEGEHSIDLNCIHCMTKCSSREDYRFHLTRRTHLIAMKKVSIKLRLTLNRLRKVQRDRQLEIEARLKNVENIASKYCQICKLYFRQSKVEHRDSDDHKKIRNFLKPYCKICHVQLLSAMKFEIHKCTLNHLKLKSRQHESTDDVDLQELDLGDFKTLDSIGDVDGEEVESGDDEEFGQTESSALGQEFVNKIEVNYCSLCREYLTRTSKDEKVIAEHCMTKRHLKWYYQSKKKDEIDSKEAVKEVVTSTSAQESESVSKKLVSPDKDAKTVSEPADQIMEEELQIKQELNDSSDYQSTKFIRYFEQ